MSNVVQLHGPKGVPKGTLLYPHVLAFCQYMRFSKSQRMLMLAAAAVDKVGRQACWPDPSQKGGWMYLNDIPDEELAALLSELVALMEKPK